MSVEPISIILLDPVIDSMSGLVRVLQKSKQTEIMDVPSAEEALQVALQFLPCVILVSLRGSLDGAPQLELLKKLEKPIRSGQLKALVISSVKNHPMARQIQAIGVTDYAEEPIPIKSLLFKINLIFKAIVNIRKKSEAAAKPEEARVFKAQEAQKPEENITITSEIPANYKPALQLGEDTFVFKNALPRKAGQKYTLEVEGPLPETGEWVPQKSKAGESEKWKWVPKNKTEDDPLGAQGEDDGWVYEGEKPSFDKGKWKLKSKKPRLDYYKKGKKVGTKLETDEDGKLLMAEDSQAAKDNLMLNKTVAAQAREELIKQIVAQEEAEKKEEELKKSRREEKEVKDKELKLKGQEEEEDGKFSNKLKSRKAKANGELTLEGGEEAEGDDWNQSSKLEEVAEKKLKRRRTKNKDGTEMNDKISDEEDEGSGAADLELRIKEQQLKGLKEEDLVGDQNVRDKISDLKEKKFGQEELPDGLDKDQLDSDKNKNLRKNGKLLSTSTGPEKKIRDRKKKGAAPEALSEEEEEEKAKEDEVENSRKVLALKKAQAKAQRRLRELKQLAQVEAEREDSEDMSDEEERALRHELGLAARPDVDKKALARRARLKKVEDLNREMDEIEGSLEGRGAPLDAMFPPEEEDDWEEHDSDQSKKRNFRVMDSDEDFEEGSEDEKKRKRARKLKASKNEEIEPELFYLLQSEVQPEEGGSWEGEDDCWIYIPNSVFESGFDKLEELLPAWVFEGEIDPELLKEEKKWKFIGSAPRKIETSKDLPKAIRNLLLNLRGQACMALGEIDGAPASLKRKLQKEQEEDFGKVKVEDLEVEKKSGKIILEDLEEDSSSIGKVKQIADKKSREGDVSLEEDDEKSLGKVKRKMEKKANEGELSLEEDEESIGKVKRAVEEKSREGDVSLEEDEEKSLGKVERKMKKKANEGELSLEEEEDEESIGKLKQIADKEALEGDVSWEEEEIAKDFGSVKLEELAEEDLGDVFWEKDSEKEKAEFSLSARELLVLAAINDAKQHSSYPVRNAPIFLRAMELAFPKFKIRFLAPGNSTLAEDSEVKELIIPLQALNSKRDIGTLHVSSIDGKNKFSRRESFVFRQLIAAVIGAFDGEVLDSAKKAA